ncbi:hypothetical protein BGX38DRAFT_264903 [Terfezia claveryi]|nr:hypothetical protein BGX38DRAFT_264903 [Terfezia claveryi]
MTDITVNYPLLPLLPPSGSYTRNSAYSTSGYNFTSTRSLPPTLWRIYNDTSVSRRLPNGGFLAGSPDKAINMNDPQGVAIEIKLHLNWYSPLKTVFISSSQNFSWIQYHAVKRELKGRKNVRVSQINTAFALECGAKIFHMVALAEFSGRKIPQRAEKSAQDEWVFLTEIPSWAVVADYTAREFAALRSPLIGTQQGWGLLPTPESQYPTLSGWGSSPYVSQSFNMGYAPSWRNMNINPALWYYGNVCMPALPV